jgi:hypothetical protein
VYIYIYIYIYVLKNSRKLLDPPSYRPTISLTSALDGVGGQRHAPAGVPPGSTRYPLCRRLGGSQGRSGQVRKISPPPGFDPRVVQPVASRYRDVRELDSKIWVI